VRYIITEKQYDNLKLLRNIHQLPKYIRASYKWLNPRSFYSFEEFVERVIFSATRDFVWEYMDTQEDYESTTNKVSLHVKDLVDQEFHAELLEYFEEGRR